MSSELTVSMRSQSPVFPSFPGSQPEKTKSDLKSELGRFVNEARQAGLELAQLRLKTLSTALFVEGMHSSTVSAFTEQLDLPEDKSLSMINEFVILNTQRTLNQFIVDSLTANLNSLLTEARNLLAMPKLSVLHQLAEEYTSTLEKDQKTLKTKTAEKDQLKDDIINLTNGITKNNKVQNKLKIETKGKDRALLNTEIEQLTKKIRDLKHELSPLNLQLQLDQSSKQRAFDSCSKRIEALNLRIKELQEKVNVATARIDELYAIFILHLKDDRIEQTIHLLEERLAAFERKTKAFNKHRASSYDH